MAKNNFPWGKVIKRFSYDLDGSVMDVVKYHPWVYRNCVSTRDVNEDVVYFSCEEINQSSDSIFKLILAWIAYRNIGLNQDYLVDGIARALQL